MTGELEVFWSSFGPTDGPLRPGDAPGSIGVYREPGGPSMPVGMAFAAGRIVDREKPLALFRLEVRKEEIPGRFICWGRRFIEADEWLERQAIRDEG